MTNKYDPELVKASWDRVKPAGDLFAARFYATLFSVHPELRDRFPISMRRQRVHLYQAVDVVAEMCDRLDDAVPYVQELGRRHATRAEKHHYEQVGGALVATFAHFDPQWDEATAASLGHVYGLVSSVMWTAAEELLTDPETIDPTPRWYHVYGLKRLDAYSSRVMLECDERPAHTTPLMWASVLGRPGWWTEIRPLTAEYAPEALADAVFHGALIIADVVAVDHRSRAIALARPGQRVFVAPEVNP